MARCYAYDLCKIFHFYCYFIITQFLPLYFQCLYLRGTKLHNFRNFLTFSLYIICIITQFPPTHFRCLKIYLKIYHSDFEGKKFQSFEKKIIPLPFTSQLSLSIIERVKSHVLLPFSSPLLSLLPPNRFISTDLVPSSCPSSLQVSSPLTRPSSIDLGEVGYEEKVRSCRGCHASNGPYSRPIIGERGWPLRRNNKNAISVSTSQHGRTMRTFSPHRFRPIYISHPHRPL